jgi:hypothetical protein
MRPPATWSMAASALRIPFFPKEVQENGICDGFA